MEAVTLVRVLGTVLCVLGIALCIWVGRKRADQVSTKEQVSVGIAILSVAALWKLLAFGALVATPAAVVAVANYHTFVGIHEVEACNRCHVMRPMVNDMRDPASDTLAARHFKNRWIPRDQCYACHSDYGLDGDLAAKMEGFRHLARYTTRTYHEPIQYRGVFDNANCLKCHAQMPKFEAVPWHHTVEAALARNETSCLNCHGLSHPTRAARTPGSPDYERLMRNEP
jgi:nitrate/TMAO reductase-like tetraheme cytochrome c subunit